MEGKGGVNDFEFRISNFEFIGAVESHWGPEVNCPRSCALTD